jgi:hypothetical protein
MVRAHPGFGPSRAFRKLLFPSIYGQNSIKFH